MTAASSSAADGHSEGANEAEMAPIPGPEEDPYIWLEEARSDEALAWVAAENARTLGMLEPAQRFEELKSQALAEAEGKEWVYKGATCLLPNSKNA